MTFLVCPDCHTQRFAESFITRSGKRSPSCRKCRRGYHRDNKVNLLSPDDQARYYELLSRRRSGGYLLQREVEDFRRLTERLAAAQ